MNGENGSRRNGSRDNGNGRYAQITGWGSFVPEKVLTNDALARVVDTSDDWITRMTGIKERHVVSNERETTALLATRAGRDALMVAGLPPSRLDLIIVATITPEYAFPSTASVVQDALGAASAGAFDLSAGCSGFLYGLNLANGYVLSGMADNVLVIGAETLSRIVDWTDRNTCVLFGDGAGAVVVSACTDRCGVLATELGSDGSGGELLILPAGGSHQPPSLETVSNGGHFVKMNGREVFRFATTVMPRAAENVVKKAGWRMDDVKLIIPHQANTRIIESAAKRLGLPMEKFFVNLDRYGNTSAASIPIALTEAVAQGKVRPGDKLVLVGFGAGLTWAAAAVEWGVPPPPTTKSWLDRLLAKIDLFFAGGRSRILRSERHAYNWVMGPVGKEDWRGRMRKRVDHWRDEVKAKAKGSPKA
jgi:3-oxoacyl-[acyl-carrier-protein] synthase III